MVADVSTRVTRLQLQAEVLQQQLSDTQAQVAQARGRVNEKEAVQAVLDEMLARNHAKTVGLYETLLTAIRQDVLPKEESTVRIDVFSERGLPAIDIKIQSGEDEESLTSGSGNSLKNVLCAGLRYIALARSPNRKFLILDEADCWLRYSRVANFAMVVGRMSAELDVQTFLISHNDVSYFEKYASVINLTKDSQIEVDYRGLDNSWAPGQKGIRQVRLKGLQSHLDTVIKLSPGLNVVTGENEIGKTAIAFALRAVGYGESGDSLIRHKLSQCVVELTLEDEQLLRWTRVRRGTPKVLYELFDKDGLLLHRTPAPNGAPDWVQGVLGISKIDGMDVQIGNNLSPIFLIDKPATQQAGILSVGREVSTLFAMIERYKKWVADDMKVTKEGEASIIAIKKKLEDIDFPAKLAKFNQVVALKKERDMGIADVEARERILTTLPTQIEMTVRQVPARTLLPVDKINECVSELARTVNVYLLKPPGTVTQPDVDFLLAVQKNRVKIESELSEIRVTRANFAPVQAYEFAHVVGMINLGVGIREASRIMEIDSIAKITPPVLIDGKQELLAVEFDGLTKEEKDLNEKLLSSRKETAEHHKLVHEFEKSHGVCPLCKQSFSAVKN